MQRRDLLKLTALTPLAAALASCSSSKSSSASDSGGDITLAGWSLKTTPEFQKLVDGFNATNPSHKLGLKEYDATNYDTQMTADLAAKKAPDLYVQKNLKNFITYQAGKQLVDVTEIASKLSNVPSVDKYKVDGKNWAIPYRADAWVLFYNKDLFKKAGVDDPDGSWTWDDYSTAATKLATALKSSSIYGTYQHSWQSTVQGFALAQTSGADLLTGKFEYLKPYYDRALKLQTEGAQIDFGSVSTNKLQYQSQFGTQKAAMMPMGTWFVATLLAQQKSGDAQKFEWGIAPIPQYDSSTTGTSKTPVTFADPTGIGINPATVKGALDASKKFLSYAASKDAATALAKIGITPAYIDDDVTNAFFSVDGAPTDSLSKFSFSTHDVKPENPASKYTAGLQNILSDLHTAVMSGSKSIDDAVSAAETRAANEVLNK